MQAIPVVKTLDMDYETWKEYRRKGIGGSDIGAIAGFNPYRSKVDVYLDKIGQGIEVEDNDAMIFGRLFEDVLAKEFARRTGFKVQRRNAILQHPKYEWAQANIDRLILDKEQGNGILEIKTANEFMKKEWDGEEVPASYLLQVQWYFFVTGLKWGRFATLIGGNKFIIKEVERDDELIGYLSDLGKDFWENHVQKGIPPAFDGSDASTELLKALYPEAEPYSEIELPDEADTLIEALEQVNTELKEIETRKKEYENRIKGWLGEFEKGLAGDHIVTWKNVSSSRFDSKQFRKDHPELYEEYLKQSSYRRFAIKEAK